MKTKIPKRNRPRLAHFWNTYGLFKKMGQPPASFSFIFGLLKQTSLQFLQLINVKKCHVHPVYGVGIRTHDPPVTT